MIHRHVLHATAAAAALACACAVQAQVPPVVQGPESVADWYNAGNDFIAQSKQQPNNMRRARNVILFVGDGMGVSTVTAARIDGNRLELRTADGALAISATRE